MSRMLARAKVKLENARNSYLKIDTDEAYRDDCCYNLQQSIEMVLKAIVELYGEQYAENHDLRANINILNRKDINIPLQTEIRNMASTIYGWETESMYLDSFVALNEDIKDAFEIADTLIKYASDLVIVDNTKDIKDIPDRQL